MPASEQARAASRLKRARVCLVCGKSYTARRADAKSYCSVDCNQVRNKAFQKAQKQKADVKRQRICKVCGVSFVARKTSAVGYCSQACQTKNLVAIHTGRTHSRSEIAKRVSSIQAFYAANPEAVAQKTARIQERTRTVAFRAQSYERYLRMKATGTGIQNPDIVAANARRARWIMKQARAELNADGAFSELWRDTKARLEREHPYDGPAGDADYWDYQRLIGKLITADPIVRETQDTFFREAIPRWGAAWKDSLGRKPPVG